MKFPVLRQHTATKRGRRADKGRPSEHDRESAEGMQRRKEDGGDGQQEDAARHRRVAQHDRTVVRPLRSLQRLPVGDRTSEENEKADIRDGKVVVVPSASTEGGSTLQVG